MLTNSEYTFEKYLIMVGIRSNNDFIITDKQLFDNIPYFEKCYQDCLSAYKAVMYLVANLNSEEKSNPDINYGNFDSKTQ